MIRGMEPFEPFQNWKHCVDYGLCTVAELFLPQTLDNLQCSMADAAPGVMSRHKVIEQPWKCFTVSEITVVALAFLGGIVVTSGAAAGE